MAGDAAPASLLPAACCLLMLLLDCGTRLDLLLVMDSIALRL